MNESFHELLLHQLQDMYDAERQLTKALPKMAKAATSKKLQEGFEKHLKETQEQVKRLEEAAKQMKISLKGVPCVGMKGLVEEGEEVVKMKLEPEVLDAALIVAAQKVEHYEIVGYASMIVHAQEMGHKELVKALKMNLSEEKKTDDTLTKLAEKGGVNKKAAKK